MVLETWPGSRVPASPFGRRRAVAAAFSMVALVGGGVVADSVLRDSGGVPASAAGAAPPPHQESVVARPGDTLWALARQHHGAADVDRYLDELIELNGGTAIQAGQLVRLP